jgi:hypothetical protein
MLVGKPRMGHSISIPTAEEDTMFKRKDHIIRNAEGEVVFDGSQKFAGGNFQREGTGINQAKRESRRLQMESDHGLGRGTVKVV